MLTAVVLPTTFVQKRATDAIAPTVGDRAALLVSTPTTPTPAPSASGLKWWYWALIGGGLLTGALLLKQSGSGLGDPRRIARESVTAEEYARRVEAWNASEAKPLSLTLLAKHWAGGRESSKVMRLLREAREARLVGRERLWAGMSKGLHGR